MKALLPFVARVETDMEGLHDYLSFQFCLGDKTMFAGIKQLRPAHSGWVGLDGVLQTRQYWEVQYDLDWSHDENWFVAELRAALDDSIRVHLRSDVEVGAYLSGGIDSSLMAALARDVSPTSRIQGFNGKFALGERFDESKYARAVASEKNLVLHEVEITEADFVDSMPQVIYHLDYPVAGPGSFPQYMVSRSGRACQGGARRTGRRRDIWRLRSLPRRLLGAVHQGRDRRIDEQRQLRGDLRVDHPESGDLARLQPDHAGVLGRGFLRGTGSPLLSVD